MVWCEFLRHVQREKTPASSTGRSPTRSGIKGRRGQNWMARVISAVANGSNLVYPVSPMGAENRRCEIFRESRNLWQLTGGWAAVSKCPVLSRQEKSTGTPRTFTEGGTKRARCPISQTVSWRANASTNPFLRLPLRRASNYGAKINFLPLAPVSPAALSPRWSCRKWRYWAGLLRSTRFRR